VNAFVTLLQAVNGAGIAPRSAEAQLLDLDGTVFVMLGLFLVLLLILWQFLWKPYLRVRDERISRVDGAREEAAKLDGEAGTRLARIETSLAEARRSGNTEMAKLRQEAQAREQQIIAEAQTVAHAMLAEARAKIETTLVAEKANLQTQTNLLAHEIAEKTLGRRLAS
jgi:F-type H+-transporting ATPase subunit b